MTNRYWLSVYTNTVYEMPGTWEPHSNMSGWVEVTVIEFEANHKAKGF